MALYELSRNPQYEVVVLLTTVAAEYRRISHHGVRQELLEQQAQALGLPLHIIMLPATPDHSCANTEYEALMEQAMHELQAEDIQDVAFGDIFLEDLRAYRENNLAKVGMRGLFPIWKRNTTEMVRTFITLGFRAWLSCVDGRKLDRSFAGRAIDAALLRDLPDVVDPCGENGEFHSFVWDGPLFNKPVPVERGETVERDVRFFTDLLPAGDAALAE